MMPAINRTDPLSLAPAHTRIASLSRRVRLRCIALAIDSSDFASHRPGLAGRIFLTWAGLRSVARRIPFPFPAAATGRSRNSQRPERSLHALLLRRRTVPPGTPELPEGLPRDSRANPRSE